MRTRLLISIVLALLAYVLDHRVYLIAVNVLVPLILIKDLISLREQVRLFINNGDPVRFAKIDLARVTIDGRRIIGLRVLSVPYTLDSSFDDALAKARAFIKLSAKYRAIMVMASGGSYVIGIEEGSYRGFITELTRLGVEVRRISGFELARAMRLNVRHRSMARFPLLLIPMPILIIASAYALLVFLIFYGFYSIMDLPKRGYVVKFGFNNEAISDTRVTRALDMTALRANAFGLISNARADVMLVILPGEEMQERIKGIASRAYSNFLAFRHVKYFLSYKGVENAIRRVQQGEGIYSIYLVSTARFNSSFKWRRIQAPPFSRVLGVRRDYAWSMELDLVFLTPFVFPLVNEEHGLAMIGRDTNNNDVYWVFGKLSPHMLIVGPTGTGKTTLAMSMAYQVKRELGGTVRVLIIDPHGHTKHLGKLMRVNVVDLAGTKVITSDLSTLVESIRMSNPLLSVGTEGALLRMAGMGNGEVLGIDDLVGRIRKLANDLILKEAYYNLYNSLALLLNYYDHGEVKPLDVNQLLNDDVIFMMGSIINDELLRYLTMLILLSVMRRAVMECRNPPCPLKYLVIIDEAHNVLGLPSEYKLLGVSNPVEKMLRELRKFGVALWVLMQPPVDVLDPSVLENMGTLVMLSGNSQYVSHLLPVISGISNDDALWLLSGRYKALVMRQGEPKPTRLVQLFVPRELIMEKNNYDFESTDNR